MHHTAELSDNITIYQLSESHGLSYHISITTVMICISVSYRLSEKSNGIYHIILIITIDLNLFIISYWLSDAYGTQFDIRYLQKLHMDCQKVVNIRLKYPLHYIFMHICIKIITIFTQYHLMTIIIINIIITLMLYKISVSYQYRNMSFHIISLSLGSDKDLSYRIAYRKLVGKIIISFLLSQLP